MLQDFGARLAGQNRMALLEQLIQVGSDEGRVARPVFTSGQVKTGD